MPIIFFFLSKNNSLLLVQKFFLRNSFHKMNKKTVGDLCMDSESINLFFCGIFFIMILKASFYSSQ